MEINITELMNDLTSINAIPAITPEIEYLSFVYKIRRVPPRFKNKQTYRDVYDPAIVSCGPYHHGKQQYKHSEEFKRWFCLNALVSRSHRENFYHEKILERIGLIRMFYSEEIEYDNNALARIIFYDACFIIKYLEKSTSGGDPFDFIMHFGFARLKSISCDMMLLENQIPFWIIKFLLCLKFNSMEEGNHKFNNLLSVIFTPGNNPTSMNMEPLHLLDAILINLRQDMGTNENTDIHIAFMNDGYRSITNLNLKGIHLKANTTNKSVKFTPHTFYGELQVPTIDMTYNGFVMFTNIIAYEMSNPFDTKLYITSYINFMRSLIEGPNDVKIMREEGVVFGDTGSADEIYKMFNALDTYGVNNTYMFLRLRGEIEKHCRSKAKTWKAELIHTYFRNPWTIIALVAASVLLCLTLLQTIFTIHSP